MDHPALWITNFGMLVPNPTHHIIQNIAMDKFTDSEVEELVSMGIDRKEVEHLNQLTEDT